ncbi:hypothetical protein EVAR_63171_1 [Eumeta japonica]|uniref:Uncharacterized protein n=1 Tax=Eumeta variegata TaxID=151549 RepID=A0A4C1Z3Q4_EUMVA|nr:hypothetical protein EVAR_63171_1 [Eumeta japonica]
MTARRSSPIFALWKSEANSANPEFLARRNMDITDLISSPRGESWGAGTGRNSPEEGVHFELAALLPGADGDGVRFSLYLALCSPVTLVFTVMFLQKKKKTFNAVPRKIRFLVKGGIPIGARAKNERYCSQSFEIFRKACTCIGTHTNSGCTVSKCRCKLAGAMELLGSSLLQSMQRGGFYQRDCALTSVRAASGVQTFDQREMILKTTHLCQPTYDDVNDAISKPDVEWHLALGKRRGCSYNFRGAEAGRSRDLQART